MKFDLSGKITIFYRFLPVKFVYMLQNNIKGRNVAAVYKNHEAGKLTAIKRNSLLMQAVSLIL
jgi:ABC-type xylose transport system permease subunit